MLSFFVISSLLLASTQAAEVRPDRQQVTAPEPQGEIVVEAPKTDRERRIELRQMTQDILVRPRRKQAVGVYDQPMCPRVSGVPEDAAKVIEARMRDNAVEIGLNHKDFSEECKHNTSVIFVPASQGTADTWFDYNSDVLEHLVSYERFRVLSEDGPVRSWSYRPIKTLSPIIVPSTSQGAAGDQQRLALQTDAGVPFYASRTRREANPIAGSVVMIELPRANGKSLIQLADYATMRTFGNSVGIASDQVPAARTILTLFQDDDAPTELTTFDRSVISMLYSTSETASRSLLYGNIARRTARLEGIKETSAKAP